MINATESPRVHGAFRALADPTRRNILMFLSERDMTIGEVSDRFEITRAAVKKHLAILEEGELISVHARGRERINHLEPNALKTVSDWLGYFSRFWDERLAKLDEAVERQETKKPKSDT
ncbi:MAG: winged helix-turn-helix transcriptional regulator [Alphaproteobacteria bacterium]|nr:winged helix-turn-helix transcriptional regulator [Alphaproteobacteria bacterium]